ncbi:MAG: fibronectin type III domain-containing protein, partial [Patescibacteria group bacterium]
GTSYRYDVSAGSLEKLESYNLDSQVSFFNIPPGGLDIVFVPPDLSVISNSQLPVTITLQSDSGTLSLNVSVSSAGQVSEGALGVSGGSSSGGSGSSAAPTAPTNLSASAFSPSQINIVWVDNSNNETGFLIYRSVNSDLSSPAIIPAPVNVTSYADTGLNSATRYYYQVYACNAIGCSGSNVANATTF